jgi:hypothetical protein
MPPIARWGCEIDGHMAELGIGWDEGQLQIPIRLRSGQAFVVGRGGLLWMTGVF